MQFSAHSIPVIWTGICQILRRRNCFSQGLGDGRVPFEASFPPLYLSILTFLCTYLSLFTSLPPPEVFQVAPAVHCQNKCLAPTGTLNLTCFLPLEHLAHIQQLLSIRKSPLYLDPKESEHANFILHFSWPWLWVHVLAPKNDPLAGWLASIHCLLWLYWDKCSFAAVTLYSNFYFSVPCLHFTAGTILIHLPLDLVDVTVGINIRAGLTTTAMVHGRSWLCFSRLF